MKKVLDKWSNSCYNTITKREENTSRKGDNKMELFFIVLGIIAIITLAGAFGYMVWETQMTPARQVAVWELTAKIKKFFRKK